MKSLDIIFGYQVWLFSVVWYHLSFMDAMYDILMSTWHVQMCLLFTYCRYTPDVVFLQELIPPYVQYLKKRAVSYLIIEGMSFNFSDRKYPGVSDVFVVYILQFLGSGGLLA